MASSFVEAVGETVSVPSQLPKLPIPHLEDTCRRYLESLEGLQDKDEHERTRDAVEEFEKGEGRRLQEKLKAYAIDKSSYIEEFWHESYLSYPGPIVLSLNPFVILEDDPSLSKGSQLLRAATLISSSLSFVHDVRVGVLEPDRFRGTPLDMYQYSQLFASTRIPSPRGCRMAINHEARHIAILRRGQFYYFEALDSQNRPVLTEQEIMKNLENIAADAAKMSDLEAATSCIPVLSTENRKTWASLRDEINTHKNNASCLQIVDDALFIVCLDDSTPEKTADICNNVLCGTSELRDGIQVGSCTNRWYDKIQLIVGGNGTAGINFEHTVVSGHTVSRFAADIFSESLTSTARGVNGPAPSLFKAQLSSHAKLFKHEQGQNSNKSHEDIDTSPKKLEWTLNSEIRTAIRFAETRLSDLISQNDCQTLEFKGYGKLFITAHGFSPDAFIQMAFQAGYYGLYGMCTGKTECTYEPAMTKAFFHGRTETIRTVRPESVAFTKLFYSDATPQQKVEALKKACGKHVKISSDCSKGFGQDKHLYALYCMLQREMHEENPNARTSGIPMSPANDAKKDTANVKMPKIFTDPGYALLGTSILCTSNCSIPKLRLFGFGALTADGFGLGYIIKDDAIHIAATSKHLQTNRLLATIEAYLLEMQKMLVMNERP